MQVQEKAIQSAIAAVMMLGLLGAATNASAADAAKEKCFGVSKAGMNDCGSNKSKHSCAGQSKTDNDPADFKLVPAGSCAKMGGNLKAM